MGENPDLKSLAIIHALVSDVYFINWPLSVLIVVQPNSVFIQDDAKIIARRAGLF